MVQPDFPIPDKSRNHSDCLPIGLLKIGSYHRIRGDTVRLVRGQHRCGFIPDRVLITSVFTYWSEAVHRTAQFYHRAYPKAQIEIGGIYATLMPRDCRKRSPFAIVRRGLYRNGRAETVPLDYSLLPQPLDYQIIHTSRGCTRRCAFCGVWRVEPRFDCKTSVQDEVNRPKVIFYDNNLLANPHIDRILQELSRIRLSRGRRVFCESQSGLDLRMLTPQRARLLRSSNFCSPRIAWDGPYSDWRRVRRAVRMLKKAGYGRKDIFVFMLFNHSRSYSEMTKKLEACRRWRVRVVDCRFRPLNLTHDGYHPGSSPQGADDYYVHPTWTDRQVRRFRQKVRHQNIAVLLDLPNGRYVSGCERRKV